jgi:hypothetical protein
MPIWYGSALTAFKRFDWFDSVILERRGGMS